jgi:hypothetical protein
VSYFNELDTYAELKGLKTKDIIDGVCLNESGHLRRNPVRHQSGGTPSGFPSGWGSSDAQQLCGTDYPRIHCRTPELDDD